jgi:hypothetical protein
MVQQTAENVAVYFKSEGSNFGTLPGTDGAYQFRINAGAGQATQKAVIRSGEIRSDGMVTQGRHGGRSVAGSYPADLSLQSHDKLIEAALRGTFTQGTNFGTVGTISSTASTKTFSIGGTINPITDGAFRIGDIGRWSGWTGSGTLMNNTNYRVLGLSSTSITTDGTVVDMSASQVAVFKRVGQKCTQGTARRSFTTEEVNLDIDASEIFLGDRVSKFTLKGAPNQPIVATFDMMGQDEQTKTGTDSPYFSSGGTSFTSLALTVEDATVRFNGTDVADVTGFDLTIEPGGVGQPVVGSTLTPDVYQGVTKITGSITCLRPDLARLGNFLNEDTLSIWLKLAEHESEPKDFHSLVINNVKLNGNTKQFAQQGPMIETISLMIGRNDTGTATGYDVTGIAYQVSNTSS